MIAKYLQKMSQKTKQDSEDQIIKRMGKNGSEGTNRNSEV